MNEKKPNRIQVKEGKIFFDWQDGRSVAFDLKFFRKECPCANCPGETILYTTFKPQRITVETHEMYKIDALGAVGDYAIQIRWKDGHDSGIYSWTYIDSLIDKYEKLKKAETAGSDCGATASGGKESKK